MNLVLFLAIGLLAGSPAAHDPRPKADMEKTRAKANEALAFCERKDLNTEICILIDMSLHSGVKRFFLYDLKGDSIAASYLVGHGCCDGPWSEDASKENPVFSNVEGSHCSSLGKYKIGERGPSDWGIRVKYVLHGLETSNNNARSRYIVFHSWDKVPDQEPYPAGTPEGWGCPTVSDQAMKEIDPILKAAEKPVLMWIYQ